MGRVLASLLMLALAFPALADSRETAPYSRAGDWRIMVDRTVGNGCFAMVEYTRGTVVRVGWSPNAPKFYIVYADSRWPRLEINGTYNVKFDFDDGQSVYRGKLKGVQMGTGTTALLHDNISTEFMIDFGRRGTLTVFNSDNNDRYARLSLDSSQQALNELLRCQKQVGG